MQEGVVKIWLVWILKIPHCKVESKFQQQAGCPLPSRDVLSGGLYIAQLYKDKQWCVFGGRGQRRCPVLAALNTKELCRYESEPDREHPGFTVTELRFPFRYVVMIAEVLTCGLLYYSISCTLNSIPANLLTKLVQRLIYFDRPCTHI